MDINSANDKALKNGEETDNCYAFMLADYFQMTMDRLDSQNF